MRMLQTMLGIRPLRIRAWHGPEELDGTNHRQLLYVVEALVHQAMHDGMVAIRFGVDRQNGEPFMKYYGPVYHTERKWWDMVSPPAESYPLLLQLVLCRASLTSDFPIQGSLAAERDGQQIPLALSMHETNSFKLAWDEQWAIIPPPEERNPEIQSGTN